MTEVNPSDGLKILRMVIRSWHSQVIHWNRSCWDIIRREENVVALRQDLVEQAHSDERYNNFSSLSAANNIENEKTTISRLLAHSKWRPEQNQDIEFSLHRYFCGQIEVFPLAGTAEARKSM